MFSFRVQVGGRLIQYQEQGGVAHESPSQREFLPLTEADFNPLWPGWAQLSIQTVLQLPDDIFGSGPPDGIANAW